MPRDDGTAHQLAARGFAYINQILTVDEVKAAAQEVADVFGNDKSRKKYEHSRIQSEREQVKLARSKRELENWPGLKHAVGRLEEHLLKICPDDLLLDGNIPPLMDVYALKTARDERNATARAAQAWHLDDYSKFPVAALILRGHRGTEFHAGPYADLASGATEEELAEWTSDWKLGKTDENGEFLGSRDAIEKQHWTNRMEAAGLLPVDDWDNQVAPVLEGCDGEGDGVIFFSNKVHRGPATWTGEERIVLFVSWNKHRRGKVSLGGSSQTDYSYYKCHLEPKLRLTKHAERNERREERKRARIHTDNDTAHSRARSGASVV